MKIFLIASNIAESPYAVFPLGISIIANCLINDNHNVQQYDYLQSGKNLDSLSKQIDKFAPDIIGISIRNIDNVNILNEQNYLSAVKDIIQAIRLIYTGKILLGGSGFSLLPEAILKITKADYGFVGEGENTIRKFITNMEKGILPSNKIIYADSSQNNSMFSGHYNKEILNFYLKHGNMAPVQTKRGCLNNCVYCTYPFLEGRSIRNRPIQSVIKDIKTLTDEFGAKMIFFTDSVFNDTERNYIKLLKEMQKQNINTPWTGFITPSGLNESDVQLMKETGLIAVELGADAATDLTLKRMGKKFTFADIVSACEIFDKYQISTALYYMIGGPGETKETVMQGIENIKSIKKAVSFIFMGIRILPNTPLELTARKENIIPKGSDLLNSIYYISPNIEKEWLEQTLTEAFKNERNYLFPPDSHERLLKVIHKLGYSGLMLDKFISRKK
jgi:radical SAM superfamily enzyme YgiQ (UPF0313 family)